jgi:hypothetical protein
MMTIGKFYRQTWWLWTLFAALIAGLCYFVSLIFIFGFPLLIAYSVFFGITRVNDINEEERESAGK